MIEWVGPTGRTIVGNVRDCRKDELECSLRAYDKQLYIKWNPKKRQGYGVWEIRRRPDRKTIVHHGAGIHTLEWKELDIIAHVLDVPILNREVLGKLQQMDSWSIRDGKGWAARREHEAALIAEKREKKAAEELRYNIRQHKREWRELMQLVARGEIHPAQLLRGMKQWS